MLTKDGKTALQLAESKGFEDICSRMTQHISSSGGSTSNSYRRQASKEHTDRGAAVRSLRVDGATHRPHTDALRQSREMSRSPDYPPDDISLDSQADSLTSSSLSRSRSSLPLPAITPDTGHHPITTPAPGTTTSRTVSGPDTDRKSPRGGSRSTLPSHAPAIPQRPAMPSTISYAIMGQHITPGHDEASIALRKQLDVEHKERKSLEAQVCVVCDMYCVLCVC